MDLNKAINIVHKKQKASELIGDRACLLGNYRIVDYVESEQIPDVILNGAPAKQGADSFFSYHGQFILTVEGHKYSRPYNIVFFDSFIVIEIDPRQKSESFVVLSPDVSESENKMIQGIEAGRELALTLNDLSDENEIEFVVEIGAILRELFSQEEANESRSKSNILTKKIPYLSEAYALISIIVIGIILMKSCKGV